MQNRQEQFETAHNQEATRRKRAMPFPEAHTRDREKQAQHDKRLRERELNAEALRLEQPTPFPETQQRDAEDRRVRREKLQVARDENWKAVTYRERIPYPDLYKADRDKARAVEKAREDEAALQKARDGKKALQETPTPAVEVTKPTPSPDPEPEWPPKFVRLGDLLVKKTQEAKDAQLVIDAQMQLSQRRSQVLQAPVTQTGRLPSTQPARPLQGLGAYRLNTPGEVLHQSRNYTISHEKASPSQSQQPRPQEQAQSIRRANRRLDRWQEELPGEAMARRLEREQQNQASPSQSQQPRQQNQPPRPQNQQQHTRVDSASGT